MLSSGIMALLSARQLLGSRSLTAVFAGFSSVRSAGSLQDSELQQQSSATAAAAGSEAVEDTGTRKKKNNYLFLGGDCNQATLMGTVVNIKHKELNKASGARPFSVIHMVTLSHYRDTVSGKVRSSTSRHQVMAFSQRVTRISKFVNVGDRLFVVGRLEYFMAKDVRVPAIVALQLVPMPFKGTGDPSGAGLEDSGDMDDAAQYGEEEEDEAFSSN